MTISAPASTDIVNFDDIITPQPNYFSIADNIQFLSQVSNFTGYYGQGTGDCPPGSDLGELKSYLMAKMLWDPSRDKMPIIEEFLRGYYGAAAPDVFAYMQLWNASVAEHGCSGGCGDDFRVPNRDGGRTPEGWLSPEALIGSARLLARGLARPGTLPEQRTRLHRAKLPTWFVILGRWAEILNYTRSPDGSTAWPLPPTKKAAYLEFVRAANESAYSLGRRS